MRLLAIDSVTEACSAALGVDGEIIARFEVARNRHSSLLLPMVEELLAEAGIGLDRLDAVAFDRGPGSFTGLRIGAGVAQGIAFSADLPVIGVSSLEVLAAAHPAPTVLAAIDARMGQVYWATYRCRSGDPVPLAASPERLDEPAAVTADVSELVVVGSGWDRYAEMLREALGGVRLSAREGRFPDAATVCRLAGRYFVEHGGEEPAGAIPVYLRDDVARKS